MRLLVLSCCSLILLAETPLVRADNSPEQALDRFKRNVLPKISFACGVEFTAEYDGASLRKHDESIAHDQTSGDLECNEPFRYLWLVCQSERGKAAVKNAGVRGVFCKGTDGPTGTLFLSNGKLVLERSAKENKPYHRLRKRFEELLQVQVVFPKDSDADPYGDRTFSDLTARPNPSLSQTDYCKVNDERLELMPLYKFDRVREGKIKCWEKGQVIVDLTIKDGIRTGLTTVEHGRNQRVTSHYLNGQLHGEQSTTDAGKLSALTHFERGKRIWWQENNAATGVVEYSHQFEDGQALIRMSADGRVYGLRCTPSARADKRLQVACGFGAPRMTRIYDGTEKVNRIETWHNGVLMSRKGGDSEYANRSEVAFKDNKKHGHEHATRADGSAEADIEWNHGVKDGREIQYDKTGTKKVAEIVWQAGEKRSTTEYYLNGQRKSLQQIDGEHAVEQTFWDNGKLKSEAKLVACDDGAYHAVAGFCEHGVVRSFYEDGSRLEEAQFNMGKRHGTLQAFWPHEKPARLEQYVDDVLQKAKRWDESGKLIADDEYEADGSRKLRH